MTENNQSTARELILYSPEDVAKILRVSRRSIYNYIKSGKLKAVKIGKEWRITEKNLIDFTNTGTR